MQNMSKGGELMSYIVRSSEKTRKSGAETETKALLYLMNLRNDSDEIYYFIVDFFNDLTGMDKDSNKLWDLQSKGAQNNSPKSIGKELVTLFKNYLSEFEFADYILFVGSVSNTFRKNVLINVFGLENIKEDAKKKMVEGLRAEAINKSYIEKINITDENILSFLEKVKFVVDDKCPSEYVKAIIKEHPRLIPEDKVLNAIFNEIRDKQSSKKNIQVVEGMVIETKDEALNYFRHITASEVRLLALQRIINRNPIEQGIPNSFMPILNKCPPEKRDNLVEACQTSLSRALFNKNLAEAFWTLLEEVYNNIKEKPLLNVDDIFRLIDNNIKKNAIDFDVLSLKYFIALVKDGIKK